MGRKERTPFGDYIKNYQSEILKSLGAKPSQSEETGLSLIEENDLVIFSPGISTAGFAEIRMAYANPDRKIIATTIDQKGLEFANSVIKETGFEGQIETRLEDLKNPLHYPDNYFDFVYARLVLHYLSSSELDSVLTNLHRATKPNGKLYIVVRSDKNIPDREDIVYDANTKMTTIPHYGNDGQVTYLEKRYFHTPDTISDQLNKAGFSIWQIKEYQEQLYKDFARKEMAPMMDHIIEVLATKSPEVDNRV